ncbi:MAG: hypothetical protein ACI9CF_000886 [Candidatus Omnitrophota bacterium]|jgi:uncharacterized protein YjeT (DUF2065 family)
MKTALEVFSVFYMGLGWYFIIKPSAFIGYIEFWAQEKNMLIGECLAILFGVLLFMVGPNTQVPYIVYLFGLIAIVKGVSVLILGADKAIAMLMTYKDFPESSLRVVGFIAALVGATLYWAI